MRLVTGMTIILALLTSCSDVRGTLGLRKDGPDAFRVVAQPPLSVPPEFSLRPPEPGAPRPQETSTREQATQIITGKRKQPELAPVPADDMQARLMHSQGEKKFLEKAGAFHADPQIREDIREENKMIEGYDWLDRLGDDPVPPEPVVDAKKESERLQSNRREGKPLNAGDVPTIDPPQENLLKQILN